MSSRLIAHLAHVEVLTPTPDPSLAFYRDVLGLEESGRAGQSVYLRGWGSGRTTAFRSPRPTLPASATSAGAPGARRTSPPPSGASRPRARAASGTRTPSATAAPTA